MILTTPTKHSYTTTKHNNKSYIFTLYLCMLLCVVGNCLLFYCSCTGNCENCCGINGNASVSSSGIKYKSEIKDKSESENENKIKNKKNDNKIEINNQQNNESKSEIVNNNKKNKEENKEEKKEEKKIEEEEPKIEEVTISAEGKIDNIQIVNKEFVKLVNACLYTGNSEEEYKKAENKFLNGINPTDETYLSAYVEVEDNGTVTLRYFIHCTNANSRKDSDDNYYGLFEGSEATKIVILRCGSDIENMKNMFSHCSSLTELILSNFNTKNVKNMRNMFNNCSSLEELDLSNFNTDKVKDMSCMFYNCNSLTKLDLSKFTTQNVRSMNSMFSMCSGLTKLDLSNFNTKNVKNMIGMFYNCFKEEQPSTLICQASTIQKIANSGDDSCLTITDENEKNDWIKNTLNKYNKGKVYTCTVKKGRNEDKPKITSVEEYKEG